MSQSENEFRDRSIDVIELARARAPGDFNLREIAFVGCSISGPAIVVPLGNTQIQSCRFDGDAEALLWEITGRSHVMGAIGAENCLFERCTFTNIGLAGDHAFVEKFRRDVGNSA
jgi:hypothetical protein